MAKPRPLGRGVYCQKRRARLAAQSRSAQRDRIWTLPVFLIVSISGVDLAFPLTFENAMGSILPLDDGFAKDPDGAAPKQPTSGPDAAIEASLKAVPGAKALSVQFSPRSSDSYLVVLTPAAHGPDAPQILAFVDPGLVVSDVVDPRTYSLGKRILVWLRVLHYGQGLGVLWQGLVFFSGFLPLLFAITGLRMWWLKRAQARAIPYPSDALAAAE